MKLLDHGFNSPEAMMAVALTEATGLTADRVYNLNQAWAGEVHVSDWAASKAQMADRRMLRLPLLVSRPLSEATRSCPGGSRFAAFHGTTVAGAMGVLRDGFLKPKPWEEGGSGMHGVYCLMTQDMPATDTLMKVVTLPKAWDGIIVEAIAFGNTVTVSGDIDQESSMVREGYHTHNSQKHSRWCVSPHSMQTTTLWLAPNAISERTVFLTSWEFGSGGGPPASPVALTPSGSGGLPPPAGSGGLPPPPAFQPRMQPSPTPRGRVELVSFRVAHNGRAFANFVGADITVDLSCLARDRWNDPDASIVLGGRAEAGVAGSGLAPQVRQAL
ncbi:MAG: hypothetical protein GY772_31105, partial [bacterium]|nr:hypothetical protein [bacterium]